MGCSVSQRADLQAVPALPDRLPNPRVLQKLAVPIIDTPRCNLLYSKDAESGFQPKAIKDDMLCAGFAEGKKDACKVGTGWAVPEAKPCSLSPGRGGSQPGWVQEAPIGGSAPEPGIPSVGKHRPRDPTQYGHPVHWCAVGQQPLKTPWR